MHKFISLRTSMQDPAMAVESDSKIVIIKDKFPKARYHFLILPHDDIPGLNFLKMHHVELLKHMHSKALSLGEKYPSYEFRFGYHAIPSISPLHLHVISQDFNSPCLKTKKHWNSFTTKFFLESEDVIKNLAEKGMISRMQSIEGRKLLQQDLKCHKCTNFPINMPDLKKHLLTHNDNH